MATRRIEPATEFASSLAALGSPDAERLVGWLAIRLAERPDCAAKLDGSAIHMLQTQPYGNYPALRLFYKFDNRALYLLAVDPYDELVDVRD